MISEYQDLKDTFRTWILKNFPLEGKDKTYTAADCAHMMVVLHSKGVIPLPKAA